MALAGALTVLYGGLIYVSAWLLIAALSIAVLRFAWKAFSGDDFAVSVIYMVLCGVLLFMVTALLLHYRAGQALGVG